jgi:hypothetical protein
MMSIKTLIIFASITGALAKGCAKSCNDDIAKTVIKAKYTDKIVDNVIIRLSRTAVKTSRFDSIFNKNQNYPLGKAVYAMAYINGKTSEDSSNLSELADFFFINEGFQKFIFKGNLDSTYKQDSLFRLGLRKAVLITYAKHVPSAAHNYLKDLYEIVEKTGATDSKLKKNIMNDLIERNFYPYGQKMSTYFFSDSVQNILYSTKPKFTS